jgi:hypothetical protein
MQEIIEMTGQLKTFAMQAGISTEEFQKFNFAIEKAGGDASDTVSIMNDLKRAMADARTGKKDWIDRFASIWHHDGSNQERMTRWGCLRR